MITVKKTTYSVEGSQEPCYLVSNGFATVRIAKCHHLIGRNTLYVTTYIDGEWNSEEEVSGDFDSLTWMEARRIAEQNCAYLYDY